MAKYYINNTDIFTANGITVTKAEGIYDGASVRVTKHEWPDKSGIDIDEATLRYKERELSLECLCLAPTKQTLLNRLEAFNALLKGVQVFSIRGTVRAAYLVFKEKEITGKYYRAAGGQYAYLFNLKLTDVNPKATKFITNTKIRRSITANTNTPSMVYWGDGSKSLIDTEGIHSHHYNFTGDIDIIIDGDGIATYEPLATRYLQNVIRASSPFTMDFEFKISKPASITSRVVHISSYSSIGSGFIENLYSYEITTTDQIVADTVSLPANVYISIVVQSFIGEIPVSTDDAVNGIFNRIVITAAHLNIYQIENYNHVKNRLDLYLNDLTQNDVNRLFEDLRWTLDNPINLGLQNGGYLNISGGTNAKPISAYDDVIETLVNDYGWTIITN